MTENTTVTTTVYLLELVDEAGASSQQQVFASIDSAKGSLDPDIQWTDMSDTEHRLWRGQIPGSPSDIDWWITALDIQP